MYPQMTMQKIADYLQTDINTIWKHMKRYGISRRKPSDRVGALNPNWKGGMISLNCHFCGKEFLTYPGQKNLRKYCSRSCVIAHTRAQGKFRMRPTKPERTFIRICEKHGLPYKYTGDGAFFIGKLNPDFVDPNQRLVVEIFGNYWHNERVRNELDTEEGRRRYFKRFGYNLIVIWEDELQSPECLMRKIKNVHRNR